MMTRAGRAVLVAIVCFWSGAATAIPIFEADAGVQVRWDPVDPQAAVGQYSVINGMLDVQQTIDFDGDGSVDTYLSAASSCCVPTDPSRIPPQASAYSRARVAGSTGTTGTFATASVESVAGTRITYLGPDSVVVALQLIIFQFASDSSVDSPNESASASSFWSADANGTPLVEGFNEFTLATGETLEFTVYTSAFGEARVLPEGPVGVSEPPTWSLLLAFGLLMPGIGRRRRDSGD